MQILRIKHIWPPLLLLLLLLLAACRQDKNTPNNNATDNVNDTVKLEVTEDGVYLVSLAELKKSGLAIDKLEVANIQLSQNDTAVPMLVQDDNLIFYGQAPEGLYSNIRPYLLRVGQVGTALPATAVADIEAPLVSTLQQTVHLQENHRYDTDARVDENSDLWFWEELRQGKNFTTVAQLPQISNQPAKIRLNLWGFTHNQKVENDHDFDVLINGQNIGSVQFDGQIYYTAELDIPSGILKEGTNEITLDNTAEGASFLDIFNVNWIEIDYTVPSTAVEDQLRFNSTDGLVVLNGFSTEPLIFDISNEDQPKLLTGWVAEGNTARLPVDNTVHVAAVGPDGYKTINNIEALHSGNWQNNENQADLLIITTTELAPALAPLIAAREEQGLSVAVATTAEIYDEFGFGEESPESLRNFVRYAIENWQEPAPQYLFIVGDATTDYLGNLGEIATNNVPSLLVSVQFSGETVSDSRLVDINDDAVPEIAVGRWPVTTVADVESLVERTLAYEAGKANTRALFATDNTESHFATTATRLAESAAIAEDDFIVLDGPQASEVAAELNEGAWLATYVGHGSLTQWGKEDVFTLDSVENLNGTTTPIVLQLTCLTGLFAHPEVTSLSEAMLTHKNGPVLMVAATSLTLSSHQEPFANALLKSLQEDELERIGDAFQAAKLALPIEDNNGLREVSDTFVLLGDPSARIVRP